MVELGDLIEPASVERAGSRQYPILSMTMRRGLVEQADKFKKRVASTDTSSYKVVQRGQLVVGFPIDEGVLSFQNLHSEAIVSPAYAVWNLKGDIQAEYLERYLRSSRALTYYASKLKGTTARRRSLPRDLFLKLPVPLPSPDEQKRSVEGLVKADMLLAKRREAITLLGELAEAIFRDMFGDPLDNPMGWERVSLGDLLARIESGKSPQCLDRPALGDEWGVLKLGAVTQCIYRAEENKALPADVKPDIRHEVQAGDLLFTRKNTPDLVAAVAHVRETPNKLLLPDLIYRLVLEEGAPVDKAYLHGLLTYPAKRRTIQSLATGSAASMPNISKTSLLKVKVELPPLSLQREFATRLDAILAVRLKCLAHLPELDALLASLQDRAFRADL
jgi:type I restriction enzyme S subunit